MKSKKDQSAAEMIDFINANKPNIKKILVVTELHDDQLQIYYSKNTTVADLCYASKYLDSVCLSHMTFVPIDPNELPQ
jgi:hypothetical protein